jgi:hypothetical protein
MGTPRIEQKKGSRPSCTSMLSALTGSFCRATYLIRTSDDLLNGDVKRALHRRHKQLQILPKFLQSTGIALCWGVIAC